MTKNNWSEVTLRDLVDIKHGFAFQGEYFTDEETQTILLTPGNFAIGGGYKGDKLKYYSGDVPAEFVLSPDDLIITMTDLSKNMDTLGYSALVPKSPQKRFLHNQRLGKVIIRNENQVDKFFLNYLLRTNDYRNEIKASASGSVIKHTSPDRIRNYQFFLPPLPEQRAIAGVLGALDDKIELNRRMNRTLESMARAVFRQWFVENEEKDWEEKPLDEIASFLNGLALQKYPAEENGEYLPVIKIAQLRKNDTTDADTASPNIPGEYIVDDGDVLFSWSGSLEVVVWCGGKGALNQHLFKVTSQNYPKWFYYLWTKHHLPEFRLIAAGKATTMGHIQRHHLHQATVIIPPEIELQEMDKVISPILELIINNEKESRTLTTLRDSLLPKLMKGEVRVKL